MSRKEEIAEALLSIQAVFLRPKDPFTWASGIHSPIYCDNRLTLSFPEVRRKIEKGLAELVREHFPEASALFGTSTAGIAHAALTAEILYLPMGYVRGSAKDHGRQNQIEGALSEGQPVVVVEDLISTGGSVIDCVEVLRENGAKVLGVVSIFTYGMEKGKKRLKEADVENYSLCDLDSLLPVAAGKGYIEEKEVAKLLRFRDNPSDESWMKE
nr:orotate phosphoribosyltransferase [uncultured Oribacterium sp.]